MDDQRFDRLARSLALGLSRRQVARGLAGGLAALGWGRAVAQPEGDPNQEDTDPSCRGKPAINNNRCPRDRARCTRNANCFCAETVVGAKRCVRIRDFPPDCPERDRCDRNTDCGAGAVCIKLGGCPNCTRRRNRCLELCR